MVRLLTFYFDPISPYAWLAWRPLNYIVNQYSDIKLMPVPVLFAGLLNSNGQLGPAEIPRKRDWLICDVARRARSQGLTVCPPPTHPFNPLLALRLASCSMAHEDRHMLTGKLLDAVWQHGKDISKEEELLRILVESDVKSAEQLMQDAKTTEAKDRLREQTNIAISNGVFGVPSVLLDEQLFWGSENDTMQHIQQVIVDPNVFATDAKLLEKWRNIQPSASRKKTQSI